MENPIITREIRKRTRSRKDRRTKLAIGIPAALLISLSYWRLFAGLKGMQPFQEDAWYALCVIQLVIICFIVPGLLANSVSHEKEQRTWALLLITRLTPWQIILGKLAARLLPLLLMFLLFVPFMVYAAWAPRLPWDMVLTSLVILILSTGFFAVQALFWSWKLGRTSAAVAASYGVVFLCTFGLIIMEEVLFPVRWAKYISAFNPFVRMYDIVYREFDPTLPIWGFAIIYTVIPVLLLILMRVGLGKARFD